MFDACEQLGLAFVPYFPLESGLLTGKYRAGQDHPEGARLTQMGDGRQPLRRRSPSAGGRATHHLVRGARPQPPRPRHQLAHLPPAGGVGDRRGDLGPSRSGERRGGRLAADARTSASRSRPSSAAAAEGPPRDLPGRPGRSRGTLLPVPAPPVVVRVDARPDGHRRGTAWSWETSMRVPALLSALLLLLLAAPAVSQPTRSGPPGAVEGLHAPASIARDERGIAHVDAANEHDLWFLQGWVHAEDRLFQMDLLRRQASGTLAEVLGKGVLAERRRGAHHRPASCRRTQPAGAVRRCPGRAGGLRRGRQRVDRRQRRCRPSMRAWGCRPSSRGRPWTRRWPARPWPSTCRSTSTSG